MKTNQLQINIPDGWERKKLSEIGKALIGLTYSPDDIVQNGGVLVFRSSNIKSGKIDYSDQVRVSVKISEKNFVKEGDILICARNGSRNLIGKNAYISKKDEGNVFGAFMTIFRAKNPKYIYQLFQSSLYKKEIEMDLGPTINQVTTGNLSRFKFNFPSTLEQNRIVSVLETWDKSIENFNKKIEAKKQIKKGLMQDLLTGRKRLSGFCDKWESIEIGKLGKYYSGITGKNKEDFGFGKPYISYMNIYSNSKINTDIKDLVNITKSDNQNQVKYGDLFFTTSSETPDEVGIASVLLDKNIGEVYLNSFCFGFRLHDFKKLIPEFAQFYFRTRHFRKSMSEIAQGASRFNLSKKYFILVKIKIPKDIKEQKAIAEILATADNEIRELEKKLQIIKDQKKYLLNNLITGTIRTPEALSINSIK